MRDLSYRWALRLLEADEVSDEVGDVFGGECVGLTVGHRAERSGEAVLQDRGDVLRRRGLARDQVRMGRVVRDLGQAGADELLVEPRRRVVMARCALLRKHGLACVGASGREVERAAAGRRGGLLGVEPLVEVGYGLDYELALHLAVVDAAKLGAGD